MRQTTKPSLLDALRAVLVSPNVSDSNLEPANLVDTTSNMASGLFAIAKALGRIADGLEMKHPMTNQGEHP